MTDASRRLIAGVMFNKDEGGVWRATYKETLIVLMYAGNKPQNRYVVKVGTSAPRVIHGNLSSVAEFAVSEAKKLKRK